MLLFTTGGCCFHFCICWKSQPAGSFHVSCNHSCVHACAFTRADLSADLISYCRKWRSALNKPAHRKGELNTALLNRETMKTDAKYLARPRNKQKKGFVSEPLETQTPRATVQTMTTAWSHHTAKTIAGPIICIDVSTSPVFVWDLAFIKSKIKRCKWQSLRL